MIYLCLQIGAERENLDLRRSRPLFRQRFSCPILRLPRTLRRTHQKSYLTHCTSDIMGELEPPAVRRGGCMAAADFDKSPVTIYDFSALEPEAVVRFAADCVETASRFFEGASTIEGLKGDLPEIVLSAIRTVRQSPGDVGAIDRARDIAARSAEWISAKSETDDRHRDSRFEGVGNETAPDEDDAYETLNLICRATAALAESANAVARSESPIIPANEAVKLVMMASLHYAGARNYWNDDLARNSPLIQENTLVEIRSHFASAALQNVDRLFPLLSVEEPPSEIVQVAGAVSRELIAHIQRHPRELYQIRPRQFEELIAEVLSSFGWQVELTPVSKDGGYDIYAISNDKIAGVTSSWIIECKKYGRENKIGVDIVRSLYGIRNTMQIAGAMLATTTHFTRDAIKFRNEKASRYDLHLKDYESVLEWINRYRPNPNGRLYING
jgi:hypothetical protein